MSRLRLLLALVLAAVVAFPAAAGAQSSEIKIVEVNTSRYDENGAVTMVVGLRNLPEALDPALLQITAEGQPVENLTVEPLGSSTVPVGVILAIDTSGSMEGAPIAAAKAAARSFVEAKRPEDFVAVVTFDDQVRVLQGFTNNTETLLARIDAIEAAGATLLNDAVLRSLEMFAHPSAANLQPNLILLADGADNGSSASEAEVLAAIGESDVRIFGIALEAPDFDPEAVRRIAETSSGGMFLQAPSPNELTALYGQIQQEINNVLVARFNVPHSAPGELAFGATYGDLSAEATAQVSGFVTTTTAPAVTTTVSFPEAQTFVVESQLPVSPGTLMLIAALATGAALALFVWILFGRQEEEGGGAFAKRLAAYGRRGPQQEEKKTLLDRLPLLRKFSQRAEEEVKRRGLLSGVNSALEQANIPLSPGEAILAAVGVAFLLGVFGWLFSGPVGGLVVFVLVILLVFGFINWAGSREKRKFEQQLPDTLVLLATSLRAGYSLLQAVEAVASEAPNPTAREFGRAIAEARLGRSVPEALQGITERTQSKDFEWAVMAIEIQREVGGNLAEVLQTVADTMLARNRLRGEIKALTAEGRISAFVLGALPFAMALFLYTSNRDYLMPLFQNTFGLIAIGVGIVLMIGGIIWLRKIIDIDV
ncbi:MAG: type II secretion system F family protein [Acidimicrobiia bacterium]